MISPITLSQLLLLASHAAGAVIEGRTNTCNAANVAFINKHSSHAIYFCDFYLSYPRTNSPFELLGASDTWSACQCIVASAASPRKYKSVTAPTGTDCGGYTKVLANEYRNPSAFCSFYMYQDRTKSPIPGLSVDVVKKACTCLTSTCTTSQSTRTTTVTSTRTAPPTTTKTQTCPQNALPTLAPSWTTTASPPALASISTTIASSGSSSTSGSAAFLLQCTYSSTADAHASLCSPQLALCPGLNYTVSFDYKFASSSSGGGVLGIYEFGGDGLLDTISGPVGKGADSAGVKAGVWGSVSSGFEAGSEGDVVCILLQCLSGQGAVGQSARVVVDGVRVTRDL